MRYFFLIAGVLILAAAVFSAGCIETDTPAVPTQTVVPAPLAGDPALGVWTGTYHQTQEMSGTGEVTEISTNYTIQIQSDGKGKVSYDRKERKGFSQSSNRYSIDGTVSKSDNVYTIDVPLLGTYVVTLSADGSATLKIPEGQEVGLSKQES